ncbi:hypothetical protein [Acidithiobacillus sp.]|mgnify:CR=1 FL=1|uniref:hypothetical protein n=1 Tax=Acidithiobacillus sp. TaxID=1872118 RepID=UPI0025C46D3B|nr:hypothetical protein [Acidithiobacillus sp.]
MARSDFYQSPVLPKKLTDNITKLLIPFIFTIIFLPMIIPEEGYPNFIVRAATFCSHYITAISVFSRGSFSPELSLVVGLISWILIIFASLLVIVMNLSGCNRKTCMNLNEQFPELISGLSVSQLLYSSAVLTLFLLIIVLPNFSWFPKLPLGFISGRGLSQYSLLHSYGGSSNLINDMFVQLYYNRFGLGVVYGYISFLSIGIIYFVTAILRTVVCKTIIYFGKK